jgi:anaerobic ribonucleoside-triphosphate reductase activating protein
VIVTALRVHAVEPRSRANGPGTRFVVWFQGCTLGCPGCFNPATHAAAGGEREVESLLAELAASGSTGLTLSGGEPMQQPDAAVALLEGARARGLSTLMFSGYARDELAALPRGTEVLALLDVLVDGRYVAAERLGRGLRGSANQRIHRLTERHDEGELAATPVAEIVIGPTGELVLTGVDPIKAKQLSGRSRS